MKTDWIWIFHFMNELRKSSHVITMLFIVFIRYYSFATIWFHFNGFQLIHLLIGCGTRPLFFQFHFCHYSLDFACIVHVCGVFVWSEIDFHLVSSYFFFQSENSSFTTHRRYQFSGFSVATCHYYLSVKWLILDTQYCNW